MLIDYKKHVADNGLTIIGFERDTHSVCVDIGIGAGSFMDGDTKGLSHAFEHMLFKGTQSITCSEIVQEMDKLGVTQNAFTNYEDVVLYAKMPHRNLFQVFDILTDMTFNSAFLQEEWDKEKLTIMQETSAYRDDLFSFTYGEAMLRAFSDDALVPLSPMAYPIIGYDEDVQGLTADSFKDFHSKYCIPSNMVISVVGNVDFDKFVEHVMLNTEWSSSCSEKPMVVGGLDSLKDFNHQQLSKVGNSQSCMVGVIPNNGRLCNLRDYVALTVLSSILGKGFNSRYFRKIREEQGMAYSVGASCYSHQDVGFYMFDCMYDTKNQDAIIDIVNNELSDIQNNGVTEDELLIKRNNVIDNVLMKIEHNISLAHLLTKAVRNGKDELIDQEVEIAINLEQEDIVRVANQLINVFSDQPNNHGILCTVDPE